MSKDICDGCGKDLSKCETIWAANGSLYCSHECGTRDIALSFLSFDDVAEELSPYDIGITNEEAVTNET